MVETGRTGWYLRVLDPGPVLPLSAVSLEARPWPEWPIARVNAVSYGLRRHADLDGDRRALARCPALAAQWRARLLAE